MRLFSVIFVIIVMTFLFGTLLNKIDTIEMLEYKLEYKEFQIDSLKHEIDTLEWNNNIWDFNIKFSVSHLLSSIMQVESNNNDSAYHKGEDAVGCLQIRRCMVNDVNRILKNKNSHICFTYNDRWSRYKSIQMFRIYCKHYNLNTEEEIARCWNGGPRGMSKPLTVNYWKKVQKNLDS